MSEKFGLGAAWIYSDFESRRCYLNWLGPMFLRDVTIK
jgi:hypothetical protein